MALLSDELFMIAVAEETKTVQGAANIVRLMLEKCQKSLNVEEENEKNIIADMQRINNIFNQVRERLVKQKIEPFFVVNVWNKFIGSDEENGKRALELFFGKQ